MLAALGGVMLQGMIAVGALAGSLLAEETPVKVVAWTKQNAIPLATEQAGNGFADLAPFGERLAGVEMIALGEDTHGSREVFQMKHRLLEYLVSEQGFSLFAIEANMPEAQRLNDYVMGGEGDAGELIRGMKFWTWSTEEVRAMVEWMRRFNTAPANRAAGRKVGFTGFDLQFPAAAAQIVREFVAAHDPEFLPEGERAVAAVQTAESAGRNVYVGLEFPVESLRGKRVTFGGWIKTAQVSDYAEIVAAVVDEGAKQSVTGGLPGHGPRGSTEWKHYEFDVRVPPAAKHVSFGVILAGTGRVWFDDLTVSLPDEPVTTYDFELGLNGFTERPAATGRVMVSQRGRSGDKALEVVNAPREQAPAESALPGWRACEERIAREVAGERPDVAAARVWARQNAHLVVQSLEVAQKLRSRDACMAENVLWLRGQNPGAKMVLWAHNGHVAKRKEAMGGALAKALGKRLAVVGSTSGKGTYRAMARDGSGLGVFPLADAEPGSVEAVCAATGLPRLILPLGEAKNAASPAWWFNLPREHRMIGAMEMKGGAQFKPRTVGAEYDFLVWLAEVQAAVGF